MNSDWELTETTGIELCEEIRRGDFDGYIYVILTSHAATEEEEIVAGMTAGADDSVAQPFNAAELLARIVAIPDNVLRKPGKLGDAEFITMKTHTVYGAEALEAALVRFPNARFLKIARDIAAARRERWNGAGYPWGLSGESIPLAARIVALADGYDALTSKRCYKEAFSHEAARSLIEEERGEHFDPRIVAAFLAAEQDFLDIHRRDGAQVEEALHARV